MFDRYFTDFGKRAVEPGDSIVPEELLSKDTPPEKVNDFDYSPTTSIS